MSLSVDECGPQEQVEDEFTCAGVLREAIRALQPTVERVFGVKLSIGAEESPSQGGQIWLQLRGARTQVTAAKLFVKGVVNQEAQKEMQFPEVLHCIFCGAKGLFMDCLIKHTSAHMVVGSPGFLLISGLTEPVVKAFSFIVDLVEKYRSGQGRRPDSAGASLESRRAFKTLVEELEDRHTLELLALPVRVKEALLELVRLAGNTHTRTLQNPENRHTHTLQDAATTLQENGGVHEASDNNNSAESSHSQRPLLGFTLDSRHFQTPEPPQPDRPPESSGCGEEFQHLLKFFTAMGFTEAVVRSVLARTGPKEASQLLDLIQQEQDKTDQQNQLGSGEMHAVERPEANQTDAKQDDFVLGVLKAAAATCGYTEEHVMEVYGNLPEIKPHELLMQLQKQEHAHFNGLRNGSQQADWTTEQNSRSYVENLDPGSRNRASNHESSKPVSIPGSGSTVKGPPQMTYSWENMTSDIHPVNSYSRSPPNVKQSLDVTSAKFSNTIPKAKPERGAVASVVTGPQRFLEGLKKPFSLQLSDQPGDAQLRHVIIDGSNVAMSHGLGVFFSCRGIALAVQHFWAEGHREIMVFVPQWRQKNNSKIKEKHYLNELHDLGLLSYTPSREVEGKRIISYDDRFMLDLAQKTNGVIVTNDNLRDLVDESPAWRDIIKKSLLQYVFAGDQFMLPDDPLGRGGPHLRDFLHKHNSSSPVPSSHSFAGVSSPSSAAPAPRAHTDGLQYRNWTPGSHGWGQGSSAGEEVNERSLEETRRLRQSLVSIFPGQESVIIMILQCHPNIRDINRLTELILEQQE